VSHGRIRALIRKDLMVVRRSRAMMLPIVAVPLILLIVVPVLLTVAPVAAPGGAGEESLRRLFDGLPSAAREMFAGHTLREAWVLLVNEQLFPALFLIVPLVVVNVIAADSFAGERERRTLEALLYTPKNDAERIIGKLLAAWIPAVMIGVSGLVVYSTAVNVAAWPVMHRVFVPTLTWIVLATWVAPGIALLGLAGMMLISLRVRGTYEAMQLGGLLVLPVVLLLIGPVRGVVRLGPAVVFAAGLVAWIAGAALLAFGVRSFRRARLIANL
jgi:ABC-2 type transport system permease protein